MLRIGVIGDRIVDCWHVGRIERTGDGVPVFDEERQVVKPGGAANAARQLEHWDCEVATFGNDFTHMDGWQSPVKHRYIDHAGKILWRADYERKDYGLGDVMKRVRGVVLDQFREWAATGPDACLMSDYDKGLLDEFTIAAISGLCDDNKIIQVVDPKKHPMSYADNSKAILKPNLKYREKYWGFVENPNVVTRGHLPPFVNGKPCGDEYNVKVLSTVGAGDCFGAILTYELAKIRSLTGETHLPTAAAKAHAAGAVYVQHLFNEPVWPLEVYRQIHFTGKVVNLNVFNLARLLEHRHGQRWVFTNGGFDILHPGHLDTLQWARAQGDCLVVGVNGDESFARAKGRTARLSLDERTRTLAGLGCVDWVVPFHEDTPVKLIEQLRPATLVKGHEYAGMCVPGHELCSVRFAPPSEFKRHARDL